MTVSDDYEPDIAVVSFLKCRRYLEKQLVILGFRLIVRQCPPAFHLR